MTTYQRDEVTKRTIRYRFPAPVDAKVLRIALAWVRQEFVTANGREPEFDNDFWLEPHDDEIAFVFEVETVKGSKPVTEGDESA